MVVDHRNENTKNHQLTFVVEEVTVAPGELIVEPTAVRLLLIIV
jgi:hypothetical protein